MSDFTQALRSGRVLLMDGAMGTELQRLVRAPALECGESYNLSNGTLVKTVHRSYLDAGAEVLLTNTFQANPSVLASRGFGDRFNLIWRAGIELAHLDQPRPRTKRCSSVPMAP